MGCLTTPPATSQRFKPQCPTSISNPAYTTLSGISQASLASFSTGTVCAGRRNPCSSAGTRSCAKQVQTASLELTKPTAGQPCCCQQTAATFHSNLGFYAEFLVTKAKKHFPSLRLCSICSTGPGEVSAGAGGSLGRAPG